MNATLLAAQKAIETLKRFPSEERPWVALGMAYALATSDLNPERRGEYWYRLVKAAQSSDIPLLAKLAREVAWEGFMRSGVGELLILGNFDTDEKERGEGVGREGPLLFLKGVAYARAHIAGSCL